MKVAIFSPFALPELGANAMRVESMRAFFEKKGIRAQVYSPKRHDVHEKLPSGYFRYHNLMDAFSVAKNGGFDAIIGTSPPLTHSFIALLGAKIAGRPVIIDLRDPWTHAYGGLGIYGKADPKLWFYKAIEFLAYNLADSIFVVTKGIGKIVERHTFNKSKILPVPNGTVPEIFFRNGKAGAQMRKKLRIPKNAKVCIYAGAFVQKDVDAMLGHATGALNSHNAYFLMVSPLGERDIAELEKIRSIVSENGFAGRFVFVDSKKFGFEELYKYYSASDIGLDPLPKGMSDYCIPVKTYDLLACGVPICAKSDNGSPLEDLIIKNKVGWVSDSWDGFAKNLDIAMKSGNKEMSKIVQKVAVEKFDRKKSNEIALREILKLVKK